MSFLPSLSLSSHASWNSEHISSSGVGTEAQEVFFYAGFVSVTEAVYLFQGQQFLPALNTHQRMIYQKPK